MISNIVCRKLCKDICYPSWCVWCTSLKGWDEFSWCVCWDWTSTWRFDHRARMKRSSIQFVVRLKGLELFLLQEDNQRFPHRRSKWAVAQESQYLHHLHEFMEKLSLTVMDLIPEWDMVAWPSRLQLLSFVRWSFEAWSSWTQLVSVACLANESKFFNVLYSKVLITYLF